MAVTSNREQYKKSKVALAELSVSITPHNNCWIIVAYSYSLAVRESDTVKFDRRTRKKISCGVTTFTQDLPLVSMIVFSKCHDNKPSA